MNTLNIRIDPKIKTDSGKIFKKMGLDTSSAIKIFLTQVIKEDGLPFKPTNNSREIRDKWDKEVKSARRSNTSFKDGKNILSDL